LPCFVTAGDQTPPSINPTVHGEMDQTRRLRRMIVQLYTNTIDEIMDMVAGTLYRLYFTRTNRG
jgi:hypothetical protein